MGKFTWGNEAKHCWVFLENDYQCFAFIPQANFPTHNLNFHWRWWDQIQAILNLFYFNIEAGMNCFISSTFIKFVRSLIRLFILKPSQNKKGQKNFLAPPFFDSFFSAASCRKGFKKRCYKMFWPFLFWSGFRISIAHLVLLILTRL